MTARIATPNCLALLALLAVSTVSCADGEEPLRTIILQFRGVVGDQPMACDQTYQGLGTTDVDSAGDDIVVDLAELVATSNIRANTPDTPPGCQSFPTDQTDCEAVFPLLGLNFEAGECVDQCAGQTVFRVEEMQ